MVYMALQVLHVKVKIMCYIDEDKKFGRQIKISLRLFSETHLYDPCMSYIVLLSVICRLYKK